VRRGFARDAAVLALLYGSGLRISEALGLARDDVPEPGSGDTITVTGKGTSSAWCRCWRRCSLIADYVALCPYDLAAGTALFVGAKRAAVAPHRPARDGADARRARASETATPHALRHSFATHLLARGGICAPSRNCSATPRCRRRRSIPRSIPTDSIEVYRSAHPRA
jgi:integrase/recombinase XerC